MPRTIRLQSDSNAHDRPWRVAVEQGFFKDEGLDVEYHEDNPEGRRGPGRGFLRALEGIPASEGRAGSLSGVRMGRDRARAAARQGQDHRPRHHGAHRRASWCARTPRSKSLADLRNVPIAVTWHAGTFYAAIEVMEAAGVPFDEIKLVHANDRLDALLCGKTEAAALMEPLVSRARRGRLPQDRRSALARRHRRRRRCRRRDRAEAHARAQPRGRMAARERGPLARGTAARSQAGAAQDRHAAGAARRARLQAGRIPGEGRLDDGPRLPQGGAGLQGRRPREIDIVIARALAAALVLLAAAAPAHGQQSKPKQSPRPAVVAPEPDAPRIELAARLNVAGRQVTSEFRVVRDNAGRELAGRADGVGAVTATELGKADEAIAREVAILRQAHPPADFVELARAPGRPQIAGPQDRLHQSARGAIRSQRWQEHHRAPDRRAGRRRALVSAGAIRQSDASAASRCGWKPTARSIGRAGEPRFRPHGDGANRNDNKYIDNFQDLHQVVGRPTRSAWNSSAIIPTCAKPPTPEQMRRGSSSCASCRSATASRPSASMRTTGSTTKMRAIARAAISLLKRASSTSCWLVSANSRP